MRLGDLAWTDLKSVARESVAVIPLASFEQHGPHLPLSTDVLILDALIDEVEARAGDLTLTLPTQWLAHSGRHNAYPGTLSVPRQTHVEMIAALADDVVRTGLGRIFLLNAQHDADATLSLALSTLRERHTGLAAVAASYWSVTELDGDLRPDLRQEEHAGRLETSLLMHLSPDSVRLDERAADVPRSASRYADRVMDYLRMDQRTHAGTLGDPESATAEEGRRAFDTIAQALEGLIRDFHDGLLVG